MSSLEVDWLLPRDGEACVEWCAQVHDSRIVRIFPFTHAGIIEACRLAPPVKPWKRLLNSGFARINAFLFYLKIRPMLCRRVRLSQKMLNELMTNCEVQCIHCVSIGTPGVRQRVTCFVTTLDGKRGVLKVTLRGSAIDPCILEANALEKLANDPWWSQKVPLLLKAGSWMGLGWILQEAVIGVSADSRDFHFLYDLASRAPVTGVLDYNKWRNLVLGSNCDWEELIHVLERRLGKPESFDCGWVHGDWAPWNVMKTADGEVAVIDWEYAVQDGMRDLDIGILEISHAVLLKQSGFVPGWSWLIALIEMHEIWPRDHVIRVRSSILDGVVRL